MSRIDRLGALLLACPVLFACGGGGSSSGGNGGGGGGGGTALVQFAIGAQTEVESDIIVQAIVTMSAPEPHDVFVHFTTTGDAQNITDFEVLDNSPILIPETHTQVPIRVRIYSDGKGEKDERVELTITAVSGAQLGTLLSHTLTIQDDDATDFQETEPNDDIPNANLIGTMSKKVAVHATGDVDLAGTSDPADVLSLIAGEDVTLDLLLDPAASTALIKLVLTDDSGNVLKTFVAVNGPGEPVGGTYDVLAGQTIYLWVTTETSPTAWFLDIVGLEFAPIGDGGGDQVPDPGH